MKGLSDQKWLLIKFQIKRIASTIYKNSDPLGDYYKTHEPWKVNEKLGVRKCQRGFIREIITVQVSRLCIT